MERNLSYPIAGCFIGTVASLFLNTYKTNPFLLFLLPMWGMVLGISIARVINLKRPPEDDMQEKALKKQK